MSGAGTYVSVGVNLGYAGSFSEGAGSTVSVVGGATFNLTGAASLSGTVNGAGGLTLGGATAIGTALLGGSLQAATTASGTVTQSGTLTLGDASNGAATVTNAGTWKLAGDVGIAAGSTAASYNNAGGSLTKTAGSGTSLVGVALTNSGGTAGAVEVASGSLEFGKAVSGAQAFKTDAGTTLIFDDNVAAGSTVTFAASTGTLQLNDAQDYKGSISGFGGNTAIDLRSIVFNGAAATPTYSGTSSGGTLTVTDGTRTATLAMLGTYQTSNFHTATDSHGGTLITFA